MWNNKENKEESGSELLPGVVQQECEDGQISERRLVRVYEDIFPMGKVGKYVKIVFSLLDPENTGYVKCGQFVQFVSVVERGEAGERVELCFNICDIQRKGVLTKQDFEQVKSEP